VAGWKKLYSLFLHQPGKMLKRSIPRFFRIIGKTASRQLPHIQMIAYAITTVPFSRAWIIRAVTVLQVFFFIAFH